MKLLFFGENFETYLNTAWFFCEFLIAEFTLEGSFTSVFSKMPFDMTRVARFIITSGFGTFKEPVRISLHVHLGRRKINNVIVYVHFRFVRWHIHWWLIFFSRQTLRKFSVESFKSRNLIAFCWFQSLFRVILKIEIRIKIRTRGKILRAFQFA